MLPSTVITSRTYFFTVGTCYTVGVLVVNGALFILTPQTNATATTMLLRLMMCPLASEVTLDYYCR